MSAHVRADLQFSLKDAAPSENKGKNLDNLINLAKSDKIFATK